MPIPARSVPMISSGWPAIARRRPSNAFFMNTRAELPPLTAVNTVLMALPSFRIGNATAMPDSATARFLILPSYDFEKLAIDSPILRSP